MFGDALERKPVPIAVVKELLGKLSERNHEQKLAFEYASKFAKLDAEQARALIEELKNANIPRFKDKHIVKLVDIMPKTADEIKAIFAKEELALSKEDIQKILDILAKYR